VTDRVFIVGVQRCGTTYLYHLLDAHPLIAMAKPVRPEPKVFLDNSVTGDPDAYDRLVFPDAPTAVVRGEKSTSYLDRADALRRICDTFPDATFLVVMRDPVERALSHYRFSVDNGVETRPVEVALGDALEARAPSYDPAISVSPFAYIRRGHYLEQLIGLERYVPKDRIRVVLFEELVSEKAVIWQTYRFLGVDVGFKPRRVAANTSRTRVDVSTDLRDLLRSHFAPLNSQLAHHLGRSLDNWQ
jgi:Sulfotransferase domain